ncbi:hypothetical protein Ciccas_010549, partial [Cichlidogyrus casuarinus]
SACDLRYTLLTKDKVRLIWRLGDDAVDYLEKSPSPRGPRITIDPGVDFDQGDPMLERVQFVIERKEGYAGEWDEIGDILAGALCRHVDMHNPSLSRKEVSYRIVAIIDGIRCKPSKPVRVYFKSENLTPDMSIAKPIIDATNVEAYEIKWPSLTMELFSDHVLEQTSLEILTSNLCYTVQILEQNSSTWQTLADEIIACNYTWKKPNPLHSYSVRIVPHNQFGQGQPSRSSRVEIQIVLPDFSYVHPTIREPVDILANEAPCDLVWAVPRQYTTGNTFYPCSYEVQTKALQPGSEWTVLQTDVKNPRLPLDMLDPMQECYLRVVPFNDFGRGNPSQPVKKTISAATSQSEITLLTLLNTVDTVQASASPTVSLDLVNLYHWYSQGAAV